MADNQHNDSDDEYQLPQGEFVQGESMNKPNVDPELTKAPGLDRRDKLRKVLVKVQELLSNRIVLAVIILVVVLFIVHLFSGDSFTTKSKAQKPVVAKQAAVLAPVARSISPNPKLLNQLNNMKESSGALGQQITTLSQQVQSMQASITDLTQANKSYQDAFIELSKKVKQLAQPKQHTKKHHRIQLKPVVFHTRAVVYNRAWIAGNDASNRSITLGDTVKSYGVVTHINAETGVISFNSGKQVVYGRNDH